MLEAGARGQLASLRRRIYLTYKYHGIWSVILRALTFPLRFTPLRRVLAPRSRTRSTSAPARRWYRRLRTAGDDRDPELPRRRQGRRAGQEHPPDDRPPPGADHRRRRRQRTRAPRRAAADRGHRRRRGRRQHRLRGERQPRAARRRPGARRGGAQLRHDRPARLAGLVCSTPPAAARTSGSSAASCCTPTTGSSSRGTRPQPRRAGVVRPPLPLQAGDWGPANVASPVLAVTGACMYITREVIERVGSFDERTRWPTRTSTSACAPGRPGSASCTGRQRSSTTSSRSRAGREVGERERTSQRVFWSRWGEFFDARDVRTADGRCA